MGNGDKIIAGLENASLPELIAPVLTGWRLPILTDEEYALLLGQHTYADNFFTGSWLQPGSVDDFPFDNSVAQSLRNKMMNADEVTMSDCCIPFPPGDPGGQNGQGAGIFDPPIENQPAPGDEPPGYPPDGGGGDDNPAKYKPPSGPFGGHRDMLCADNKVLSYHGTNHTGNFFDYGAPHNFANVGFGLLPVNDLLVDGQPFKDAIDDKIAMNAGLPTDAIVKAVYFEHNGNWLDSGHAGFFMDELNGASAGLFNFRATRPHLKPVSGSNSSEVVLNPTRLIKMADIIVGGSWSDNIKFGLETIAGIDENGKYTLVAYDKVDEIFFTCRMPPTTPNIFFSNSDSPVFELCIVGVDYELETTAWSGHFDIRHMSDNLGENPFVSGQTLYWSDDPDGHVGGQSTSDFTSHLWGGSEIAGQGDMILSGAGGLSSEVALLGIADGFTTHPDRDYTNLEIQLLGAIMGAQTLTVHIHLVAGGPGYTFDVAVPNIGHFSSTPYTTGSYTFSVDVTTLGLTESSTLQFVGLEGSYYLQEWACRFS